MYSSIVEQNIPVVISSSPATQPRSTTLGIFTPGALLTSILVASVSYCCLRPLDGLPFSAGYGGQVRHSITYRCPRLPAVRRASRHSVAPILIGI
jgi:hypothetical protein